MKPKDAKKSKELEKVCKMFDSIKNNQTIFDKHLKTILDTRKGKDVLDYLRYLIKYDIENFRYFIRRSIWTDEVITKYGHLFMGLKNEAKR